jgi:MOSC domain-containing protein YiiM
MKGTVVAVCSSQNKNHPKEDVDRAFLEPRVGLSGDAHAGTERELSLLAQESVDQLAQKSGIEAPPGSFAENMRTEGIDLTTLRPGTRLSVGPTVIQIIRIGKDPSEPHTYSFKGHSLLPKVGAFARVLRGGIVKKGDTIRIATEDNGT